MPRHSHLDATSREATLKDVARRAGVAWSTASYAINGGPRPVSPEVRERVLEAARDLNYQSNLLARSLVTGRAQALGVLVRGLPDTRAAALLCGAEAAARWRGYQVLLAAASPDAPQILMSRRVDALLWLDAAPNSPTPDLPTNLPHARATAWPSDFDAACDVVSVDIGAAGEFEDWAPWQEAGELAARRLIERVERPELWSARRIVIPCLARVP